MTLKCLKIDFYANKIANFLGTSAKMSYNLCRPFYILKNIRRPKSEISTYDAQEIAMNEMWTQREYDAMTYAVLDGSTTDQNIDICTPALLHARHNAELFSKFAFLKGEYSNYDMGQLDITNVRDWSAYIAISSAGQGSNGDKAVEKFKVKTNNRTIAEYCQSKSSQN